MQGAPIERKDQLCLCAIWEESSTRGSNCGDEIIFFNFIFFFAIFSGKNNLFCEVLLCLWFSSKLGYFGWLLRHRITWYLAGCYLNLQCSLRYWNKIFKQGRREPSAAKLLLWVSSFWFCLCSSIQYKLRAGGARSSSRSNSTSTPSQQQQTEIFKGDQIMVLDEPSTRKQLCLDCARHHKALLVLVGRSAKSFVYQRGFLQGITQYRVEEMVSVWRYCCCWGWRLLEIKEHCGRNYPPPVLLLPALPAAWTYGFWDIPLRH